MEILSFSCPRVAKHSYNYENVFQVAVNNQNTMSLWGRQGAPTLSSGELKRNLMAHGEAREEKWRGKRRMEWVASTHALYGNTVYPALLTLMRTLRLPAADWTDNPADINGLVRFAGRPNLVSARVPSHSVSTLLHPRPLLIIFSSTSNAYSTKPFLRTCRVYGVHI